MIALVRTYVACACFALALAALVGATPAPTPSAGTPAPKASGSPTPAPLPTRPLAAPSPSLPDTSPFGQIGKLERNRTTKPSQLAPFLQSTDPAIVARAEVAIGRLHSRDGVALLVPLLSGQQPDNVKAAAAFALGLIGSADALSPLRSAALHGSPLVAGTAADSLGRIGGSAAIETLTHL